MPSNSERTFLDHSGYLVNIRTAWSSYECMNDPYIYVQRDT